jgi:ribosomal 30S subunit maturation factor RimM
MYQNKGSFYMKPISNIQIILNEQGKKVGVIMKVKQFKRLMNDLEDLQDLRIAYIRTQKKEKTIPFEQVMKDFFNNVSSEK